MRTINVFAAMPRISVRNAIPASNCVPEARTVTGKIRPVHSDPFGDAIGCSLCDIGEVAVPTFSTRETGRSNTFLMVCIHAIGPFALERIAHL